MKMSFGLDPQKKKIAVIAFSCLLIAWSIFLFFVDISSLVNAIGLHNIYVILFVIAGTAGTSFFTSAAFYAVFLSYVHAGFNPIILGILGGVGMAIGDSIYFYLSSKIGDVLKESKSVWYEKVYDFVEKLPPVAVYIFTYLYASFAPTPNDILMVILGALKFKFRYVIVLIVLGNITLLTLIAYGINITFLK